MSDEPIAPDEFHWYLPCWVLANVSQLRDQGVAGSLTTASGDTITGMVVFDDLGALDQYVKDAKLSGVTAIRIRDSYELRQVYENYLNIGGQHVIFDPPVRPGVRWRTMPLELAIAQILAEDARETEGNSASDD